MTKGIEMSSTGQKIKSLRKARQMTLRALGLELEKLGGAAKFSAIAKWEKDAALPSKENVKALCKFFNVDPAWLMFDEMSAGDQLLEVIEDVRLLSPQNLRLLAKIVEAMKEVDRKSPEENDSDEPKD